MVIQPIFWNWLILMCLFLVVEVFSFSFFFIFWAMAAAAVAIITIFIPDLSLPWQALWFALLSIIGIGLWWRLAKNWQKNNNDEAGKLNNRGKQLIGRVLVLQVPIINGSAHMQIDDSLWILRGEDMPAGSSVVVVQVNSMELEVARME